MSDELVGYSWRPGDLLPAHANSANLRRIIGFETGLNLTPRSLEHWPVRYRVVDRKRIFDVGHALEIARAKIDAAPVQVMR